MRKIGLLSLAAVFMLATFAFAAGELVIGIQGPETGNLAVY
jgi:hypothetical protein